MSTQRRKPRAGTRLARRAIMPASARTSSVNEILPKAPPSSMRLVPPPDVLEDDGAAERFHTSLAAAHRLRLTPSLGGDLRDELARDQAARIAEARFVEGERAKVRARAAEAPRHAEAFVAWFEGLKEDGPGQGDPLFPWLAERASREDLRWFLRQEVAGEAGFDDLVALTQVKLPARPKLELARNYWDEMGQGHAAGMHGPLLDKLSHALALHEGEPIVWESVALGNLMVALASNRRYAYQSIGALGVIELTAPGRAVCVNEGLKRVGIAGDLRRYYALHATLDVKHSAAWNKEALLPIVAELPDAAPAIAEGALMRLEAGARCFARYRRRLW